MASIQIKNVPDDVRTEFHQRAAMAGQSLQEYLLEHLTREARNPSVDQILARAGARQGVQLTADEAVQLVHADRGAR